MAGSGHASLRDPADEDIPLQVKDLVVEFNVGRGRTVHAVSGISFDIARGETLGLVGESGCGKSTTARAIAGLLKSKSGSIIFEGEELTSLAPAELRSIRPRMQVVFQDPISSLNPRRRVRDIVGDPLRVWGRKDAGGELVSRSLEAVGLDPDLVGDRLAHQLSGGQCQRVSIARALILSPELLICDEPVSALDVSVQAQVLNLLEDLKSKLGLTMVFVSHDLAVVRNVTDRTAVMYLGKLCEILPSVALFEAPMHPYTVLLANASNDSPDSAGIEVKTDEMPSVMAPPSGCRFRTRCPFASSICAEEEPMLQELKPGHFVACHHPVTVPGTIPVRAAEAVAS